LFSEERSSMLLCARRFWLVAVSIALLLSLEATAFAASAVSDSAQAGRSGSVYTLQDNEVRAYFSVTGSHPVELTVEDRANARQVHLPDAFILTFGNGSTLPASEMRIVDHPAIAAVEAKPEASRYSDRIPGKKICSNLQAETADVRVGWCVLLRDGSNYVRQEVTIAAGQRAVPLTEVTLLQFNDAGAQVAGSVKGSPVTDATMFFGFEYPLSLSSVEDGTVRAWLPRILPLNAGQRVTYSSVIGVAPAGQMRRAFLRYLERERAHPYRTFLHYNTWYDLANGGDYDQQAVLSRVRALGEELVRQRHVVLDSFLLDEGWDNTHSLWQFNSGFPDGFTPIRQAAAQYGFGIGVWFSPWGGYDEAKKERIAFGRAHGYEIVNGGYALSGPRYYDEFQQVCLDMVEKYGVNQFKLDGTGNANQVVPGSHFDSDFDAVLHLIERVRQHEPNIFINLTNGTYPSPFWLRYTDSVWRGGEDHSFAGVGSWRQRWITYRDAETYQHTVKAGPLFPLNSLMLHGLIYARLTDHLSDDPGNDFPNEVRSYFATGTQLQEMYITPSLLSREDWDTLAECARWSRAHAAILRDTHWIGGDPAALEVYGWAAWALSGWIVTLRNPSDRPQEYRLNLNRALELPTIPAAPYSVEQPFALPRSAFLFWSGQEIVPIELKPFEVRTFESTTSPGTGVNQTAR